MGYDLMIGRKDRLSNKVLWRIHACSENKSELTITVCPQGIQGWKKLAYCVPFLVYYRPLIHKYLRSVVSGYKYFLTTGRPVPRNHFGALTPYSPAV